jgi:hypothetical protein
VCVRGVAALDRWLAGHGDAAAFVVWEPVIVLDGSAPGPERRARHARNYWDASRAVSTAMLRSGVDPACAGRSDGDDAIVWDALFDFAPSAATPSACGRTILRELPSLR